MRVCLAISATLFLFVLGAHSVSAQDTAKPYKRFEVYADIGIASRILADPVGFYESGYFEDGYVFVPSDQPTGGALSLGIGAVHRKTGLGLFFTHCQRYGLKYYQIYPITYNPTRIETRDGVYGLMRDYGIEVRKRFERKGKRWFYEAAFGGWIMNSGTDYMLSLPFAPPPYNFVSFEERNLRYQAASYGISGLNKPSSFGWRARLLVSGGKSNTLSPDARYLLISEVSVSYQLPMRKKVREYWRSLKLEE